jgi:hypothetical protein
MLVAIGPPGMSILIVKKPVLQVFAGNGSNGLNGYWLTVNLRLQITVFYGARA